MRAAVGVAVGVAVVLVALWGAPALVRADVARFAAVPFKESGKLPKNEAWRHQDAAVALVREMTHPNDFIITDYHMIAFLSGRKVPPELAVISGKRLAVGALGDHQLIAITERYRPAALLLWSGDRLSSMWGYTRWLRESRYRIARTLGDEFTLLVPDVPELMPLRLAEAGEGG